MICNITVKVAVAALAMVACSGNLEVNLLAWAQWPFTSEQPAGLQKDL